MGMRKYLILAMAYMGFYAASAQGLSHLRINEVQVENRSSIVQEQGLHHAWIEIENTSWSTQDIGGCYITNNRKVLDKGLSASERHELMSPIATGSEKTEIGPKEHFIIYADGETQLGVLHASFVLTPGEDCFIALYEANGVALIDSVTVPASLKADYSYAKIDGKWKCVAPEDVSPGTKNNQTETTKDKVAEFKEKDPYGIAMTIMALVIVLGSLLLLALFFMFFSWIMKTVAKKKARAKEVAAATPVAATAELGTQTEVSDDDAMAVVVIGMAVAQMAEDVHDKESGVITIRQPQQTAWNNTNKTPLRMEWNVKR